MDNEEKSAAEAKAQEEAIERQRIEIVFSLGGGELDDKGALGFRYTYDGPPEYATEMRSEMNALDGVLSNWFTAIVDEQWGPCKTPKGYERVGSFTSSGEGECWCKMNEDNDDKPDPKCLVCEGDGTVYLGEGETEVVFRPTIAHRDEIIEAFAKAIHACAWASCEEEHGRSHGGCKIEEVMDPVTEEAKEVATAAIEAIEWDNGKSIGALYEEQVDRQRDEEIAETFSAIYRLHIPNDMQRFSNVDRDDITDYARICVALATGEEHDKWSGAGGYWLRKLAGEPKACRLSYQACTPEGFGSDLGMQWLGTGVAWADDHPKLTFEVPHGEFHYFSPSEYGGEDSDEEEDEEPSREEILQGQHELAEGYVKHLDKEIAKKNQ